MMTNNSKYKNIEVKRARQSWEELIKRDLDKQNPSKDSHNQQYI